jgi:hypothetical protein
LNVEWLICSEHIVQSHLKCKRCHMPLKYRCPIKNSDNISVVFRSVILGFDKLSSKAQTIESFANPQVKCDCEVAMLKGPRYR